MISRLRAQRLLLVCVTGLVAVAAAIGQPWTPGNESIGPPRASAHEVPETLTLTSGGQFVVWSWGLARVADALGDVAVAWKFQGVEQGWVSYVPAFGRTNYVLEDGDVLWIVSPTAQTIAFSTTTPPMANAPFAAMGSCDFVDGATAVAASTAQVVTTYSTGTAFYIGNDEWVTAAHVVARSGRIRFAYGDARSGGGGHRARRRG